MGKERETGSQKRYSRKVSVYNPPVKIGQDSILTSLDIELTERCNNDCIHCYINLPAGDALAISRELSFPEIESILREAASLGCLSARFTGGEPLLRKDFREIYVCARKLGMRVTIFTNACLITEPLADLLAHIPPLEKVEVTVYGMSRESCKAVTHTPDSFGQARRGIDLLSSRNIPFMLKAAMLPPFIPEKEEFEKWARTSAPFSEEEGYSMLFNLRGRRDSQEKNRQIEKLRMTPDNFSERLSRDPAGYAREMRPFFYGFKGCAGRKLFTCGAGVKSGCLDAYGNLQMCLLLRHPDTVYNLHKGPVREAMCDFFPRIRQAEASDNGYLARCARCFIKNICGQCPARSWMEHGTLDRPVEYLCDIAHGKAQVLGLIKKGEHAWEVEGMERVRRFLSGC